MSPTTPEEREDVILQILNNKPNGIGFNQLQIESSIPRKTLHSYLSSMQKEGKVNIEKLGGKPNSELQITANFSEKSKRIVKHNLDVTTKQHWTLYRTKIQKSNVFPHYLQQLASEYYQYMMFHLFDGSPLYKFALRRLEDHLDEERKKIQNEFDRKTLSRIYESCDELSTQLWTDAISSMRNAGMRNLIRTRDEIRMDAINTPQFFPVEPSDDYQDLQSGDILKDSRIDLINNKKTQEEFLKLLKEYNDVSSKLTNIRDRIIHLSGIYPFEKAFPKEHSK